MIWHTWGMLVVTLLMAIAAINLLVSGALLSALGVILLAAFSFTSGVLMTREEHRSRREQRREHIERMERELNMDNEDALRHWLHKHEERG